MHWDFSHLNLQGRSFKGQDLTGANFSYSDIRGANFTNAILKDAKFINAQAGLQPCWELGLVYGSLFLAALSGFTSAIIGGFAGVALTSVNQPYGIFISVILLITLAVFCVFTIRKGLVAALETIFWAMALIVTVYAAAALVVAIAMVVTATGPSAVAQAWTNVGTVGRTVVAVGVMALQLAISLILLAAGPLAVAIAWTKSGAVGGNLVAAGAALGAALGVLYSLLVGTLSQTMMPKVLAIVGVLIGTLIWTVAVAGLSAYASWRFLAGDEKHGFVWEIAIALAVRGGTKFRGADLTDADFTGATLKNTDFRRANLTRCCWLQSKRFFCTSF